MTLFRSPRTRAYATLVLVGLLAGGAWQSLHAVDLSTAAAATQNFDSIGSSATVSLPADFRVDKLTTVRTVGTFASAGTTTTAAGGPSLSSTASQGIYNFGAGTSTSASVGGTDRAIGFLSSGSGTNSGNLYEQLANNTGGDLTGLTLSYAVEKYRNGTNASGFRIQLYYSADGTTWTSAGNAFLTSFGPDSGANSGFTTAPGVTVPVTGTLTVAIPSGSSIYLAWNYSVISGSTVTNSQALAIDDISVQGVASTAASNPTATTAANPSTVLGGEQALLTVSVTPGANPTSTGLLVSADLSSIGGSPSQPFFDDGTHGDAVPGDNVFSLLATVGPGAPVGTKALPVTVTDAEGRSSSGVSLTLTVNGGSTPPSGTAGPVSVAAGGTASLIVTVTPGTNPTSTDLTVTADLTPLGGASSVPFVGSGNMFTYAVSVPASTPTGARSITATIGDGQGRASTAAIPVTVTAPLADSTVVISQVYGGGGNSGATYHNDFVQLYNRGTAVVDLTGWSLAYASATGSDWSNQQPLGGTIGPGQYFLIALASGGSNGGALPAANVNGQINISATSGKLALLDDFDQLTDACPSSTHLRDLVGYGTANCREGSGDAPAPSATKAIFRKGGGFIDTNDNLNDFAADVPAPVSTAPIVPLPPQVFATDPTTGASTVPRDATIAVTFTEPVTADDGWFDITCSTTGVHDDATVAVNGITYYITPNTNFVAGEHCTATVLQAKIHDPSALTLPANDVWTFSVATGAAPPEDAGVNLALGNPTLATADLTQPANYLMVKPEYTLSYNRDLGRPNWVSWHLTQGWISGVTRVDAFRADPQVPSDWYRVESFDFSGSGFDRGHMSPSADRVTSTPVNQATFLMSNMVAQAPDNNQGPWENFESYLRSVVNGEADPAHPNEIYVIAGPAGVGGTGSNGSTTTTAGGHVTVPAYTWKVALVLPDDGASDDPARVTCATRTLAVIMPNVQGIRSDSWQVYLHTVADVETLTGYHFFTNVPTPIQGCIKAGLNGSNPKISQTITFASIGNHTFADGGVDLDATASSGLAIAFSVSGPATVVNGRTLHFTGAGPVTVTAAQTGDINYAAAPSVVQTFTVAPAMAVFSNLAAPVIEAGTGTVTLGGHFSAGPLVPPGAVAIGLAGNTAVAPIAADGTFSATLPSGTLAAAAAPYSATFSYAGATDFASASAMSAVSVVDTTAPAILSASASPNIMLTPNHKMFDVFVAYRAIDLSGTPVCSLAVTSNEPVNGTGDGNTSADWQVIDAHDVSLRAERAGTGSGRVYTIAIGCADAFNNRSTTTLAVTIPK